MAAKPRGGADAAMGPGTARFMLRTFNRILGLNTAALERMAQMDRALGGEYVFDKTYLEAAVRDLCGLTHRVAYHLNGMAGEGYVELYDAFLAVKDSLEDILSGGMGPLAGRRVLAFSEIGWETEPLAGTCATGLAVLGRRMGLPAPDGLSVTVTGMRDLAGKDAAAREVALAEVEQAVEALFVRTKGSGPLEITLSRAGTDGPGAALATAYATDAGESARTVMELAARYAAGVRSRDNDPGDSVDVATGVDAIATLRDAGSEPVPLAACIRLRIPAQVTGTLQTLAHDPNLPPAMLAVASSPENSDLADRYWLSRTAPHASLRARISPKQMDFSVPGGTALAPAMGRMLRGSAWLTPAATSQLAELGMAADRAYGGPCLLSWVLAPAGGLRLTGMAPVDTAFPEWAEALDEAEALPSGPEPLLEGGQVACGGVGAGPVVLVSDDTIPESVPLGSVGVARTATPALSRMVPRLGALLAEVGTAASHLATVARENRVPAVFGLKGATTLTPGAPVTVDAGEGAVYPGVVDALLRQAALQDIRVGSEPEYLILRRLLRHIRPLNLVDPAAGDFDPAHCRTCHDILHFCHEKAVDLLLAMDTPGSNRSGLGASRRLAGDSPFDLGIVDLGGGLAEGEGEVSLEDVTSLPLRAFLEGLFLKEVRRQDPARLSLGDIVAGMGRTSQALSAPPGSAGLNLAIASRDYANITLRLGYHFSVVDAVVTDRPEHTFVYFRFAGGFADGDRRARRAGLLLTVLHRLGFRATRKGDLVVGKRKLMESGEALDVLRFLGALSAYTRQLDVELASEEDVERFATGFLDACGLAPGGETMAEVVE